MASKDNIIKDLKFFTGMPHRRTGTENGVRSAEYIRQRFQDLGMQGVTIEHADTSSRSYNDWYLKAGEREVPCYFINGTLLKEETSVKAQIRKPLVYVGEGSPEDYQKTDVSGKIVVADIRWTDYTMDVFRNNHSTGEACYCDEGEITSTDGEDFGIDNYTPNTFPQNLIRAMDGGAEGFIGILWDNCDHYIHYNEDYNYLFEPGVAEDLLGYPLETSFHSMEIPGLCISRSEGEALIEAIQNTDALMGEMELSVERSDQKANVVFGKLPGKSDDVIIVHSHHDSVFEGAVQDGAAMSCVLEIARYFAGKPFEEREKTLIFAATDTHYTDYEGHEQFIKNRLAEGEHIILDVSLEHIGLDMTEAEDGTMQLSGKSGLKLIYTTENADLLEITRKSVLDHKLKRAMILPVNKERGYVCSDGALFYEYGIPVVSLIGPVRYLMDPVDTFDKVDQTQLEPVSDYAIQVVEEVACSFDGTIEENACMFNGKVYEKIH